MPEITTRRITANGIEFAIDECGTGDAVALCLHGFPESRWSWRYQLPLLAALGWRAVAPDLRGYGETDRPPRQADYRIDHLVDDAAALFDALGAKRRLLVAHDWGAGIAWIFAMRKARRLDGLVIMNLPHPAILTHAIRTSPAQRRRSWYMAFFQLPWLPEVMLGANGARAIGRAFSGMAVDKSAFPPAVTGHYRANALKPGALKAMINYYRANTRTIGREPTVPIDVPTLMIWGEADTALGVELTAGHDALVDDFTLIRLPDVSHWVQQEAPERVNAVLSDWLTAKGLAPGGEKAG